MIFALMMLGCGVLGECAGLSCPPIADELITGDYTVTAVNAYGEAPEGSIVRVEEEEVILEYRDEDGNRWEVRWPVEPLEKL